MADKTKAKAKPKATKAAPQLQSQEEAGEGPGLNESAPLTAKQAAFVDHYLVTRNATHAARLAGYEGDENALAVAGHRTLRNAKISEAISKRTSANGADADEILSGLAHVHRGSLKPFFQTADDGTIWPDLGSDEAVANFDLLKKIKVKKRQGGPPEDRWTETEYELEIHDPLRAKELLGRHHKLFTDKTELSGPDGGMVPVAVQFIPYDRANSDNS